MKKINYKGYEIHENIDDTNICSVWYKIRWANKKVTLSLDCICSSLENAKSYIDSKVTD